MRKAVSEGSSYEGADGIANLQIPGLQGHGASPGFDHHASAILLNIASQAQGGAHKGVGVREALQLTQTLELRSHQQYCDDCLHSQWSPLAS